jgi:tRNA(Ile)-lysidine synthase
VYPSPLSPLQADARQWRYSQLAALAARAGAALVATGHTATDRAETLLLNMLRGSGPDGLSAMAWRRPLGADSASASRADRGCIGLGQASSCGGAGGSNDRDPGQVELVRPLLDVERAQTGAECARRGLQVRMRGAAWQGSRPLPAPVHSLP